MRVAVLGGKGLLGRNLTPLLRDAGHHVVVSSRSADGPDDVRADFTTGEGIAEAVAGADVVVHLVSDVAKQARTDIHGTQRLLRLLEDQHLVYVSIVGVDRHPYKYYRTKLAVERMIEESGWSHTILRATQFHDFLVFFIDKACRLPLAIVPKRFVFQPIDTRIVAKNLAALVDSRPQGLQPDLAGPAVHDAEYLARSFMEARGRERPMVNLPMFGEAADAFRLGLHTNPERAVDTGTWEDFVADRWPQGGPPY